MTHLVCGVTDCASNCKNYCTLSSIQVRGRSAGAPTDTACANYQPRKGGASNHLTNQSAQPDCMVHCGASHCTHNCRGQCRAEYVSVQGGGVAGACCGSFRSRPSAEGCPGLFFPVE